MARIHQPLRRQSDGRWDYTVHSDEESWLTHPIGYCAGWPFDGEPTPIVPRAEWDRERAAAEPYRAKYHADGHATAEEASVCYDEYQLDRELRAWSDPVEQHRCVACGAWTQRRVAVGAFRCWAICADHHAREAAAAEIAKERAPR